MPDEIDIDDFGLQDEDFLPKNGTDKQNDNDQEMNDVENDQEEENSKIRENALFIHGVDDLSTKDVQKYVLEYLPDEDFKIEWINDTSVNVVFHHADATTKALSALTSEAVYYDGDSYGPTQLRDAKTHPEKRTARLQIRFSLESDRKERGSRQKSKYYLFHGEPTFEDERYRLNVGKADKDASKLGYRPMAENDEEDLFPNKLPGAAARQGDRAGRRGGDGDDDDDDLFPEKLNESAGAGHNKNSDRGYRSRNRPSYSARRRQRSRSPQRDLGNRLGDGGEGDRWVKGSALGHRISKSKSRRRAADMF